MLFNFTGVDYLDVVGGKESIVSGRKTVPPTLINLKRKNKFSGKQIFIILRKTATIIIGIIFGITVTKYLYNDSKKVKMYFLKNSGKIYIDSLILLLFGKLMCGLKFKMS
jgi:hypothetical protein